MVREWNTMKTIKELVLVKSASKERKQNDQEQNRSIKSVREQSFSLTATSAIKNARLCVIMCLLGAKSQKSSYSSKNTFQQWNKCSKLLATYITFMQILSF